MKYALVVLCACLLPACALLAPQSPPPAEQEQPPAQETLLPGGKVVSLEALLPSLPECVNITQLPSLSETPSAQVKVRPVSYGASKKEMPVKAVDPQVLIKQMQEQALVKPTADNFFGKSADMVYTWEPGKRYPIYLAPEQTTGIFFPPKEEAIVGLALDKEGFSVLNKMVGEGETAYTIISITPQPQAKGTYDAFVAMKSGRRYNLRLIVGDRAVSAIFETPQMHGEK